MIVANLCFIHKVIESEGATNINMAVLKPNARINHPRIKPKMFKRILKDPTI